MQNELTVHYVVTLPEPARRLNSECITIAAIVLLVQSK